MRHRWMLAAGVAAVLLLLSVRQAQTARAQQAPPAAERAARAYAALQRSYTVADPLHPGGRVLAGQGANRYSYLWPLSRTLQATLALEGVPGQGDRYAADVEGHLRTLGLYWDPGTSPPAYASYPPPPYGIGGDLYYDDNAWIGVPLLGYARLTGDPSGLAAARRVFDFLVSGWDTDPARPDPGGVFWVAATWNGDRNTVSTAPAALIAGTIYELTGEGLYLDWALKMAGWLDAYLLSPEGLYWDHVRADGSIDRGIFASNQGAMIGVNLMLARVTGDPAYADAARRTADAMLRRYASEGFDSQSPAFTAIFAHYLLMLWAQTGESRYRTYVEGYALWAWQEARDPETDTYGFTLRGAAGVIEQGILAQAALAEINALLTWTPAQLGLLV